MHLKGVFVEPFYIAQLHSMLFFSKMSLFTFWIVNKYSTKKIYLFRRHGKVVARYPWIFIVGILLLSTICSLGIITFRWENNIVRLWNPKHSETLKNFDWLWKNHPPDLRRHSIIFHGDNVLDPEMFKDAFRIRELLYSVTSDEGVTWPQACLKVNIFQNNLPNFA